MKKTLSFLLAVLLTFCLFGCDGAQPPADTQPTPSTAAPTEPTVPDPTEPEPTEPEPTLPPPDEDSLAATLPEGASVFGLDLSGKNLEQATAALGGLIDGYRLRLTVNNTSMNFSAEELSMDLSAERFAYWFAETVEGNQPGSSGLILCNINHMISTVKKMFGETAKNAAITYRRDLARFVTEPHRDGEVVDTAQVETAAVAAIRSLSPTASATATVSPAEATVKESDPRVQSALKTANSYLDISLSYSFQAEGIPSSREDIDIHTLASFLTVQRDYSVTIDETAVQSYVNKMAMRHGGSRVAPFVTTYGTSISYNVEYYKAVLDQTAMCKDLINCLKNRTSGTRSTTYLPANNANLPYGGDYVEVNLSDQRLWVYRNGEMMVTTPLVSGNVSTRKWTDPGVFTIYERETDCTLAGANYVSYVDYWMAFNGPIGLHDASWRSEFGGSIYKYNGSHGCVNLPPAAAKQVYDVVYVGMKVIVYGGAKSVSSRPQEITGTTAYTVSTDTEPFKLDISLKYEDTEITYISSDPGVVRVNDQGVVTVVGAGTAKITVISETYGAITSGNFTVTITVEEKAEPTEPPTEPPTDPPSESTDPSEPTEPLESIEPSESTEPTDPTELPTETDPAPATDPETIPEE